ncbi:MAG: hypothetical protein HOV80_07395 [Polyangiaceae bacterium]|nr:hypothetical protein [Polyangiaceae bacterium]
MHRAPLWTSLLAVAAVGCSETSGPYRPAGETGPSALEEERFVKRLYLDLTGVKPADDVIAAGLERLAKDGNNADTRAAMATELVAEPAFAASWVEEIEIDAFGGARREDVYDLFCSVFLTVEPSCQTCLIDPDDLCSCDCETVRDLRAEREVLRTSATDFGAGTPSVEIDRRIAESFAFQVNGGDGDGIAEALFTGFLGRSAEPEEMRNVRAFVLGDGIPNVAAILFHEQGSNYRDLVDIVFASEPYRDAVIDRVFFRYLGRKPTPAELAHFSGSLDPVSPDVRPLIVSVTSSREYFEQ